MPSEQKRYVFVVGDRVRIRGLVSSPRYNGKAGTILGPCGDIERCWTVRIEMASGLVGEERRLREEHLEPEHNGLEDSITSLKSLDSAGTEATEIVSPGASSGVSSGGNSDSR